MPEQSINIGRFFDGDLRRVQIFFFSLLSLFLSACVPGGEESVNTDLFKDKADMKAKAAEIKPGMTKAKVFEKLGIPEEKFEDLSMQDIQLTLYGNFQVQGTPEQLEKFKQRMLSYEGYALPYRLIKSDSSLGFGTMKVEKKGHDLKLVLIFDRNKLIKASVEGIQSVKQEEDEPFWGTLIRRGIGFAF